MGHSTSRWASSPCPAHSRAEGGTLTEAMTCWLGHVFCSSPLKSRVEAAAWRWIRVWEQDLSWGWGRHWPVQQNWFVQSEE